MLIMMIIISDRVSGVHVGCVWGACSALRGMRYAWCMRGAEWCCVVLRGAAWCCVLLLKKKRLPLPIHLSLHLAWAVLYSWILNNKHDSSVASRMAALRCAWLRCVAHGLRCSQILDHTAGWGEQSSILEEIITSITPQEYAEFISSSGQYVDTNSHHHFHYPHHNIVCHTSHHQTIKGIIL